MYRKYSNDVAQQAEIQGSSTFFVARQIYFVVQNAFMLRWRLYYTISAKQMDASLDAILV